MFDRLAELARELEKLESEQADLFAAGDQQAAIEAGRRIAELTPVVDVYRQHTAVEADLAEAREMATGETDPEMKEYLRSEIDDKEARREELETRLKELLVPKDPNAGKNVIVEIRGAEGGDEANIWAGDLFRMYEQWAERHRWKTELLSADPSDMGGFNQVIFVVRGDGAWGRLKFEGGPHRVQRVPATESQGRIHTSSATVAVLPEADEVDV